MRNIPNSICYSLLRWTEDFVGIMPMMRETGRHEAQNTDVLELQDRLAGDTCQ